MKKLNSSVLISPQHTGWKICNAKKSCLPSICNAHLNSSNSKFTCKKNRIRIILQFISYNMIIIRSKGKYKRGHHWSRFFHPKYLPPLFVSLSRKHQPKNQAAKSYTKNKKQHQERLMCKTIHGWWNHGSRFSVFPFNVLQ